MRARTARGSAKSIVGSPAGFSDAKEASSGLFFVRARNRNGRRAGCGDALFRVYHFVRPDHPLEAAVRPEPLRGLAPDPLLGLRGEQGGRGRGIAAGLAQVQLRLDEDPHDAVGAADLMDRDDGRPRALGEGADRRERADFDAEERDDRARGRRRVLIHHEADRRSLTQRTENLARGVLVVEEAAEVDGAARLEHPPMKPFGLQMAGHDGDRNAVHGSEPRHELPVREVRRHEQGPLSLVVGALPMLEAVQSRDARGVAPVMPLHGREHVQQLQEQGPVMLEVPLEQELPARGAQPGQAAADVVGGDRPAAAVEAEGEAAEGRAQPQLPGAREDGGGGAEGAEKQVQDEGNRSGHISTF